jgi:hypothetical protein
VPVRQALVPVGQWRSTDVQTRDRRTKPATGVASYSSPLPFVASPMSGNDHAQHPFLAGRVISTCSTSLSRLGPLASLHLSCHCFDDTIVGPTRAAGSYFTPRPTSPAVHLREVATRTESRCELEKVFPFAWAAERLVLSYVHPFRSRATLSTDSVPAFSDLVLHSSAPPPNLLSVCPFSPDGCVARQRRCRQPPFKRPRERAAVTCPTCMRPSACCADRARRL